MTVTSPCLIQSTCLRLPRAMNEAARGQDRLCLNGISDVDKCFGQSWKLLAISSKVTFLGVISLRRRTMEANWQDGRNM